MLADHEMEELKRRVHKVARNVAFRWPHSVEADDLEQDVLVSLLESPGTARPILEADPREAEQMLFRLANREASKAREQYEYFSYQFNYSVEEVRFLLEEGVLTEAVDGFDSATADLTEALEVMTWEKSPYTEPILTRFVDGAIPDRKSGDEVRLRRSIDDLTRRMNRVAKKRSQHGLKAKKKGGVPE